MNRAKLTLALATMTALSCVALPPPLPPGSDPANPRAPEAPAMAPPPVLGSEMQQEQDGGMQHDHMHHGATRPAEARDGGAP